MVAPEDNPHEDGGKRRPRKFERGINSGWLENKFHGELNLPGRAGIADAASRAGDLPEGCGADDSPRLVEVRVIEDVKEFGAKFPGHALGDLCVFD